ncbi:MAG: MBL fold metallo-hydrolase [Myxococcota bacterium]
MFDVVFLGTAASTPSIDRGLASLLVRAGRERFLIDCGEGTQRQLLKSGVGFRKLSGILLTHAHLDHILGLPGFLSTLALLEAGGEQPMLIGASPGTLRLTQQLLRGVWPSGRTPLPVTWRELAPGVIHGTPDLEVRCFTVRHGETDSLGYVFESPTRRHLIPERLAEVGVPHGPERAKLARGEPITLADGRVISPDEVTSPPTPGTKLVVVGDVEDTTDILPHARGAAAIVIEATFLGPDTALAKARAHLTARAAAELARDAGVKALYLTHISGRYGADAVLADAQSVFADTRVAHDFLTISV